MNNERHIPHTSLDSNKSRRDAGQLYGQLIMYAQIQTNEATANDLTTTFP